MWKFPLRYKYAEHGEQAFSLTLTSGPKRKHKVEVVENESLPVSSPEWASHTAGGRVLVVKFYGLRKQISERLGRILVLLTTRVPEKISRRTSFLPKEGEMNLFLASIISHIARV